MSEDAGYSSATGFKVYTLVESHVCACQGTGSVRESEAIASTVTGRYNGPAAVVVSVGSPPVRVALAGFSQNSARRFQAQYASHSLRPSRSFASACVLLERVYDSFLHESLNLLSVQVDDDG